MKLPVVEEARFSLVINGQETAVVHCTPESLEEFATGYLFTHGIIASAKQIGALGVCHDLNIISVTIPGLKDTVIQAPVYITSACGQNVVRQDSAVPVIQSTITIPMTELKRLALEMFKNAVKYHETGGIHCASLAVYDEEGNCIASIVREDVGRHNALDKVIGWALSNTIDFTQCVLVTSGRIAYDMIVKVLAANIPILVSRSIPTSLALETARKSGITLVGRIERPEPIVYCGAERISAMG